MEESGYLFVSIAASCQYVQISFYDSCDNTKAVDVTIR